MTTTQPPSTPPTAAEDLGRLVAQDARRLLQLCRTAEKTTKADVEFGNFLADCLDGLPEAAERRVVPGARFQNPVPWFEKTRLILSDLGAKLAHDGAQGDPPQADASPPRWRLTSDDVTHAVHQLDRVWQSLPEALDDPRTGRPRIGRDPSAPPELLIYKLYILQDRLSPPAVLGPWVDWNRVTRWLSHCDTHHTAHCQLSPKSERLFGDFPSRLIDVERMCVVPFDTRQRYAALSYVWGVAPSLMALRRNIDRLQQNGALDFKPWADGAQGDPVAPQFPLTIRHAMELTRQLGERLLWVDALCIVQDDDTERQHQLERMGSIYANAYVTIVAAGGTALSGLRGIHGATPRMERKIHTPQHLTHYGSDRYLHTTLIREHQRVKDSVWSQRGWTFQEQIFSRRLLILDNTSVTWECHCAVWLEGMEAAEKECQDRGAVAAEGFAFSAEPNFAEYARHVTPFNRRQLTYPEDALDAFAGILAVLNETAFKEGFICGLPVRFFEAALLWYNKGQLERRQAKRQGGAEKVIMPPSWAWAAWGGVVEYDNIDLGVAAGSREDGDKKAMRWQYGRPLVSWKYQASSSGKDWTTVTSSFGWRLSNSDSTDLASTRAGEIDGKDAQGRPDEGTRTERGGTTTSNRSHSHLLLAYPLRAFFEVQQTFGQVTVIMSNGSGGAAGSLTSGGQPVNRGQVCELVAVSISSMNGEEAYDVLWIEWEGGIAYRKGVGRIRKAAWEAKDAERIKLVLG